MRWRVVVAALTATGLSAAPGDDFDAFASSSWLQAVEIPAHWLGWSAGPGTHRETTNVVHRSARARARLVAR
jgi:hypothetical protein